MSNGPSIEDLFNQMVYNLPDSEPSEPKKKAHKPEEIEWRSMIFEGDTLILDHAQNDYNKVFRFTVQALVELHNNKVQDFRVTIQNRKGDLYFMAIGEKTQLTNYKKASDMK